jgi:hypothetical protein
MFADNVPNEIATNHRSQQALNMLSLYTLIFPAPAEGVVIYPLKPLQEYLEFTYDYFLLFFRSGVTVVNFVLQANP